MQKVIDNTLIGNEARVSALKSIIPQNNQDLNNSSLHSAKHSVNILETRLRNALFDPANKTDSDNPENYRTFKKLPNFANKNYTVNFDQLNFYDDQIFDNQAFWMQGFETSAAQDDVNEFSGYDYSNRGFAIGADQEVAENLRLGVSASLSAANVQSKSLNKKETNIDSYQFNFYGGYNFSPYFISGVLGVAVNQYNSIRQMPELGLQATAKFDGQTYISAFESGMIKKFSSGLTITPKISLTAARNQISTYSESGAGTLNLSISNERNNFLEGRIGSDLSYDNFKILSTKVQPKIKLSYGYDFLASDQSSTNHFQGQSSSFQIKNSNIDKSSLKYGFGFGFDVGEGILLVADYDVEEKASYKSKSSSLYLRYDF